MNIASHVAAVAAAACLSATAASAALTDGSYELRFSDLSFTTIDITGSFAVIGGTVSGLAVTTDALQQTDTIDPQVYSGTGINGSTGTMLSATLTTVDRFRFSETPSTFTLAEDGTFVCDGFRVDGCILESQNNSRLSLPSALTGTYEIVGVIPAVPLPAGLPLALTALAGFAVLRRRT